MTTTSVPTRHGRPYRAKLQPYRLLALLTWGEYSWASWDGDRVTVAPAALARLFRISRERVVDYVHWLAAQGFVEDVVREPRKLTFTVRRPARWRLAVPGWGELPWDGDDDAQESQRAD